MVSAGDVAGAVELVLAVDVGSASVAAGAGSDQGTQRRAGDIGSRAGCARRFMVVPLFTASPIVGRVARSCRRGRRRRSRWRRAGAGQERFGSRSRCQCHAPAAMTVGSSSVVKPTASESEHTATVPIGSRSVAAPQRIRPSGSMTARWALMPSASAQRRPGNACCRSLAGRAGDGTRSPSRSCPVPVTSPQSLPTTAAPSGRPGDDDVAVETGASGGRLCREWSDRRPPLACSATASPAGSSQPANAERPASMSIVPFAPRARRSRRPAPPAPCPSCVPGSV